MPNSNLEKLPYENYLIFIDNSEGISLFNNYVVRKIKNGKEIDILKNGTYSGAYYVGGILSIMNMIDRPHATVHTTLEHLSKDDRWQNVKPEELKPGDVIAWETGNPEGSSNDQIGFYADKKCAFSTSYRQKKVIRHSPTFDDPGAKNFRKITRAFRFTDWDNLNKED